MVVTLEQPTATRRTKLPVIDCDIHPALKSKEALDPYLPERWQRYREMIGGSGFSGSSSKLTRPLVSWPFWVVFAIRAPLGLGLPIYKSISIGPSGALMQVRMTSPSCP